MKKPNRIEITAFRRRTTIVFGEEPYADPEDMGGAASYEEQIIPVEALRSPELRLFIEALVKSNGDSARAAERLGLSRSGFYAKLRGLGLSIKQLRTRLNFFRDERDARKQSKGRGFLP